MISDRRLLLLACTQRKRHDAGLLPAVNRYNGPTFQVVRKYLHHSPSESHSLDIFILSARYGLIASDFQIPDYDQRLTIEEAKKLSKPVLEKIRSLFEQAPYSHLCISAGRDYLFALDGIERVVPGGCEITQTGGSQGRKLSILRRWLYAGTADETRLPNQPAQSVYLRGIQIALSPVEVYAKAREALQKQIGNPYAYQSWYVAVDDQRIAPKWLVSRISGLPTNSFQTTDALRVLRALGVEVRSV